MWLSCVRAAEIGQSGADRAVAVSQAPAFSWGGYLEAVGLLFLLLAALWVVVWCIRHFGKFNFLPRPGSLPRDALVMEAQMPLGPRKGLMVVRFLNRRLLLGVSEQQVSLLAEAPVDEPQVENVSGKTSADNVSHEHANFQAILEDVKT